MLLQRKLNGGKERTHDTFFAGLFGGYLVFGERNSINEQVCLFFLPNVTTPSPPSFPPRGWMGGSANFVLLVLF